MASFGNGEDENENGEEKPSTSSAGENDMLKMETESIVRQFVYDQFEEDEGKEDDSEVSIAETARPDALEELRSIRQENDPESMAVRVSKRLREVGDDINMRYHEQFQDMISQLNLTSANVYTSFAKVARRLFQPGISWNRIVALMCFGYEIAKHVLRNGLAGTYMRKMYQAMVEFIDQERIAAWITQNGGWLGFLTDFHLNEPSWSTVAAVVVLGVICVAWSLRSNQS